MASNGKATKGDAGRLNADSEPTLPHFISFPLSSSKVNLAKEIGTEYKNFGTLLLEDEKGMKVDVIEKKQDRDSERINEHIVQQWLRGEGRQPVTWDTLVAVLEDIKLLALAKQIKDKFQESTQSTGESRVVTSKSENSLVKNDEHQEMAYNVRKEQGIPKQSKEAGQFPPESTDESRGSQRVFTSKSENSVAKNDEHHSFRVDNPSSSSDSDMAVGGGIKCLSDDPTENPTDSASNHRKVLEIIDDVSSERQAAERASLIKSFSSVELDGPPLPPPPPDRRSGDVLECATQQPARREVETLEWASQQPVITTSMESEHSLISAEITMFNESLRLASSKGDVEEVDQRLKKWNHKNHNINETDKEGKTALILAAENGHECVVCSLLETRGIDINYQTEDTGRSALFFAHEGGHDGVVNLLLQYGADANRKEAGKTFFKKAKKSKNTLLNLCKIGDYEGVKHLLEERKEGVNVIDVNHKNWTPLIWACDKGYYKIVELLLKHGASINLEATVH